ncbi:MAG: hypothetical protein M1491_06035 [Deltaproteobacteria bacterium]|nr:hypothetical protein [Deltaproteobacteria bacterium]
MKTYFVTFLCLILFAGAAGAEVSTTGQSGTIDVPSAFIQQGRAAITLYDAYASQNDFLVSGGRIENNTVYAALSYAPLRYLEVSIGSLDSTSLVDSSQVVDYSGDLRIGIKGSYDVMPGLAIGGLAEVLAYSKTDSIGYNGSAASYTLSLLASYDMRQARRSFPLVASLRIGYLWDNTRELLSSDSDSLLSPIGKYAMGIRGDDLTLLALSVLFPLPRYYIEPMLEFTSQFSGRYASYVSTDQSYGDVSFNQNPVYITPGVVFYTPVKGLRVTGAVEIAASRRLLSQSTGGYVSITPQAVWIGGISYTIH